ncbi:MAG: hypothetical protein R2838_05425 [Caldilineaceae bacterium]
MTCTTGWTSRWSSTRWWMTSSGDLRGQGTCALPQTIPVGGSYVQLQRRHPAGHCPITTR